MLIGSKVVETSMEVSVAIVNQDHGVLLIDGLAEGTSVAAKISFRP